MLQTLFYVPDRLFGLPLFGAGLLLAVWAVGSVVLLGMLVRRQGFNGDTLGYAAMLAALGAIIWLLLPRLVEPGGGVPIRGYGMLLLLAVVCAVGLAVYRGRRLGIDPELVMGLCFWIFIPGIVGARLFYVIEYWPKFYQAPATAGLADVLRSLGATAAEILNVAQGGLIVYGSLFGGLLGLLGFVRWYKLPLLATCDLMIPSMFLGLAIGRIGCLLNGCCFGGLCDASWAVTFPPGSPPYQHQAEHGQIALPSKEQVQKGEVYVQGLKVVGPPRDPPRITAVEPGSAPERRGLAPGQTIVAINGRKTTTVEEAQHALRYAFQDGPTIAVATSDRPAIARWRLTGPPARSARVHPTQLYSAIDAAVLCLFLLAYDPFRRRDGELIALGLTIYPITRFLMEWIRTDEPKRFGPGLTIGQVVSLALLVGVAGLWLSVLRRAPGKAFPPAR